MLLEMDWRKTLAMGSDDATEAMVVRLALNVAVSAQEAVGHAAPIHSEEFHLLTCHFRDHQTVRLPRR